MNEELDLEVGNSSPVSVSANNSLKRQAEKTSPIIKMKKRKIFQGMNARALHIILQDDPIKFCQDIGLLSKGVKCPCGEDMKLSLCAISREHFVWRCKKNGEGHRQTIRKGTWFEKSRLAMVDILWVAYMWLQEYSLKSMLYESGLGETTVREWCGNCNDLCREILEHKSGPLGGEQKTVEIFQCLLKKEKGKQEKWFFCALEYNSTKTLLISEDQTSESMVQIFNKYFLPGTTVVGRVWTFYENVTKDDFESFIREKSLTFYDLVTKVKMDTFEEFKKKTRQRPGLCKLANDESFFEKIYRKSLFSAPDAYLAFLKDVSTIYKPVDVKSLQKQI